MKRFISVILCVFLLTAAVGCTQVPLETVPPTQTGLATSTPTETSTVPTVPESTEPEVYLSPLCAVSLPLAEEVETAEDGTIVFSYTFQNIYATFQDPDIADFVVLDLLNRIDSTRAAAESLLKSAVSDYSHTTYWSPYFLQVLYNPTRIDQSVLSLYGTQISYNGSSHPSHLSMSANYDLVTGTVLHFGDILAEDFSAEHLSTLISDALAAYSDILYTDYTQTVRDRFSSDIRLYESWYFSLTGLCFYFSPYDIAPYSAGTIIAEIPYEDLTGILRDDYFPAEHIEIEGSLISQPFDSADHSQINQYVELILHSGGQRYLLQPEGTIFDVRIEQGSLSAGSDNFISQATVFAAECLSSGEAILLQDSLSETGTVLRLSYRSNEEEIVVFIEEDGTIHSI